MTSPYILLITGPSASGKSTLAKNLGNYIAGKGRSQVVFALDNYYRDLSHLSEGQRAQYNFDRPEAWEYERILRDVRMLKNGQPVEMPIYDFHTHMRSSKKQWLHPSDYMIFEGLFALCYEELRALANLKVYVDLEDSIALQRRIQRDTAERGRTRDSVIEQFRSTVQPANEAYIHPSKSTADVIILGKTSQETQLGAILKHLEI